MKLTKKVWLIPGAILVSTIVVSYQIRFGYESTSGNTSTKNTSIGLEKEKPVINSNSNNEVDYKESVLCCVEPQSIEVENEMAGSTTESNKDSVGHKVKLPSEQVYSPAYRDNLIESFQTGTMTSDQRRDYFIILNHPVVPAKDKQLLHKEFMQAFQQRRITPNQMIGAPGT